LIGVERSCSGHFTHEECVRLGRNRGVILDRNKLMAGFATSVPLELLPVGMLFLA